MMAETLQVPKDIDATEHDQGSDVGNIAGMAELVQQMVEAMASDGDERMLEKFVQVLTKLSPSLGDSVNAVYRKRCDISSIAAVSCGNTGGDGGNHQDGGDGIRAPNSNDNRVVGVNSDEALPSHQGSMRSKRVLKEDQDESLPPGKRPSHPVDKRTMGSAHIVNSVNDFQPELPNRSSSHKGVTSDNAGLTSDSLPSVETHLNKELQPHAVWRVDHWSHDLICSTSKDIPDGPAPALSTWQLQDYQLKEHLDGGGTVIAIVDSGINPEHVAFSQRILWAQSFVPGGGVADVLGHGTMCAGIACGARFEGSVGTTEDWIGGVAPGAKLAVCKVVPDGSAQADLGAVCDALDFIQNYNALNPNQPVNVISLSFGTPYFNRAICSRVHTLAGMGVVIVCAASNEGRLKTQPIAFPARLGHVLCVGSHCSSGRPSPFSAVGREIDFLAPGENVWAPSAGGPQAISCASGTSYAAPAVAGLICLVLQYLKYLSQVMDVPLYECAHSVWAMREILKEMATSPGHHSEELGFGALEPAKFFEKHIEEIKRMILKMVQ